MNDHIATELEGAGWPEEAAAVRRGVPVGVVLERLRNEWYPPDDLIEWLEREAGTSDADILAEVGMVEAADDMRESGMGDF